MTRVLFKLLQNTLLCVLFAVTYVVMFVRFARARPLLASALVVSSIGMFT